MNSRPIASGPRFAIAWLPLAALMASCAQTPAGESPGQGSRHTHRFQLPPEQAARCFARNAEEHSGALVSEVRVDRDASVETIVRVKNGITYATARFRRAGAGSTGDIHLMVVTSGRRSDLLDALVAGC